MSRVRITATALGILMTAAVALTACGDNDNQSSQGNNVQQETAEIQSLVNNDNSERYNYIVEDTSQPAIQAEIVPVKLTVDLCRDTMENLDDCHQFGDSYQVVGADGYVHWVSVGEDKILFSVVNVLIYRVQLDLSLHSSIEELEEELVATLRSSSLTIDFCNTGDNAEKLPVFCGSVVGSQLDEGEGSFQRDN